MGIANVLQTTQLDMDVMLIHIPVMSQIVVLEIPEVLARLNVGRGVVAGRGIREHLGARGMGQVVHADQLKFVALPILVVVVEGEGG